MVVLPTFFRAIVGGITKQGLLTAPLIEEKTPKKHNPKSSPSGITDITDEVNKQAKDLKEEKRKRIIDAMFSESVRLMRANAGKPRNHSVVSNLTKAGIDIKIVKPKGKKKNYSATLKEWLYTQKFTENITSPDEGWDRLDKFVKEAKSAKKN